MTKAPLGGLVEQSAIGALHSRGSESFVAVVPATRKNQDSVLPRKYGSTGP
jgi:hypothetical protein